MGKNQTLFQFYVTHGQTFVDNTYMGQKLRYPSTQMQRSIEEHLCLSFNTSGDVQNQTHGELTKPFLSLIRLSSVTPFCVCGVFPWIEFLSWIQKNPPLGIPCKLFYLSSSSLLRQNFYWKFQRNGLWSWCFCLVGAVN